MKKKMAVNKPAFWLNATLPRLFAIALIDKTRASARARSPNHRSIHCQLILSTRIRLPPATLFGRWIVKIGDWLDLGTKSVHSEKKKPNTSIEITKQSALNNSQSRKKNNCDRSIDWRRAVSISTFVATQPHYRKSIQLKRLFSLVSNIWKRYYDCCCGARCVLLWMICDEKNTNKWLIAQFENQSILSTGVCILVWYFSLVFSDGCFSFNFKRIFECTHNQHTYTEKCNHAELNRKFFVLWWPHSWNIECILPIVRQRAIHTNSQWFN